MRHARAHRGEGGHLTLDDHGSSGERFLAGSPPEAARPAAAARTRSGLTLLLAGAVLATSLCGCSRQRLVAGMTAPLIEASLEESFASGDVRTVREGLPGQLLLLRGLCRCHPDHTAIWTTTVQLYASYAMMFAQGEDAGWAEDLYAEGKDVGLRFLMRKPWFADAWEEGPDRLQQELARRKPAELGPILMWTAACLGQHILAHQDRPREMLTLPYVDVLLEASIAMNGAYFYGMPYAVKGVMLATMPRGYGGNLEESDRYFEKAMAVAQNRFLLHQVLYARHHAVAALDEGAFTRALESVLAAEENLDPEVRFINLLAREQAAELLQKRSELF